MSETYEDILGPDGFEDFLGHVEYRRPPHAPMIARTVLIPLECEGSRIIACDVDRDTVFRAFIVPPALHGIFLVRLPPAIPEWTRIGHLAPDALFRTGLTLGQVKLGSRFRAEIMKHPSDSPLEFEGVIVGEQLF